MSASHTTPASADTAEIPWARTTTMPTPAADESSAPATAASEMSVPATAAGETPAPPLEGSPPPATAPALAPPTWSGKKTAVAAALAIGFSSVGAIAAAAALPAGSQGVADGRGMPGGGQFQPGGQAPGGQQLPDGQQLPGGQHARRSATGGTRLRLAAGGPRHGGGNDMTPAAIRRRLRAAAHPRRGAAHAAYGSATPDLGLLPRCGASVRPLASQRELGARVRT